MLARWWTWQNSGQQCRSNEDASLKVKMKTGLTQFVVCLKLKKCLDVIADFQWHKKNEAAVTVIITLLLIVENINNDASLISITDRSHLRCR